MLNTTGQQDSSHGTLLSALSNTIGSFPPPRIPPICALRSLPFSTSVLSPLLCSSFFNALSIQRVEDALSHSLLSRSNTARTIVHQPTPINNPLCNVLSPYTLYLSSPPSLCLLSEFYRHSFNETSRTYRKCVGPICNASGPIYVIWGPIKVMDMCLEIWTTLGTFIKCIETYLYGIMTYRLSACVEKSEQF